MSFDLERQCREATRLRASGKFTEALALLDQAIRLDSRMAEAYVHRCACYCDLEEYAKAIEDATQAIVLAPEEASPLQWRARAADCLGRHELALADLNKALQLASEDPWLYYERSLVFAGLGDYGAAIADINRYLERCAEEGLGYYVRAGLRLHERELDLALGDIDEAVRFGGEDASNLYLRARILHKMNRVDEASAQLEAAVGQNAKLKPGRLGASIAMKRGNYRKAIEHLNGVVETEPRDAEVYYHRSLAWCQLCKNEKALCDIDEAIRIEPENGAFLYLRAQLLYSLGRLDDASVAIDASIAQKGGVEGGGWESERSWLRGAIALKQGECWEAIAEFGAALETNATNAHAYIGRGEAWYQMKEYERALSDFDEAVRFAPEIHHRYLDRANALMGLGRYAEANRDLVEARRLGPDCAECYRNLAWFRATCPDAEFRNGKEAVALAHEAIELGSLCSPWWGGVALAAAYAECGDFNEAIRWQTKVLATAPEEDRPGWEMVVRDFRAGIPRRMKGPEGPDWRA